MIKIGYYIQKKGSGHLNRAMCLEKHLNRTFIDYELFIFTDKNLPKNKFGLQTKVYRAHSLYSIESQIFDVFVCDLCPIIAKVVRPLTKKLVYILLNGVRDDALHKPVYDISDTIICPFNSMLAGDFIKSLKGVQFSGGFTKTQYVPSNAIAPDTFRILVLLGTGGTDFDYKYLEGISNVMVLGKDIKVSDPCSYIAKAEIVIGNAI